MHSKTQNHGAFSWGFVTQRANALSWHSEVPFRVLRHFTYKASVMSVNAEAYAHSHDSADWLMSVFVNELAPPHVRSQQGQCVQQCRKIMKGTLPE